MQTLISNPQMLHFGSQFTSQNSIFLFSSFSWKNSNSLSFTHRKWLYHPRIQVYSSATSSESLSYNGWEDPRLGGGSSHPGGSNQLQNLLNSFGIGEKKYIFVYLLGFICALVLSRIRVSTIVIFPACALVFAAGFSIGYVNSGNLNELSLILSEKRSTDEFFRVSKEKLRSLMALFDGYDSKISTIKKSMRRGIERKCITVDDVEDYVKVMDSVGLSSSNAKGIVEDCINSILIENQEVEKLWNERASKRKNKDNEGGIDILMFIGNLFRGRSTNSKPSRIKDDNKKDPTHLEANDQSQGNILRPSVQEKENFSSNSEELPGNEYPHMVHDESKFSHEGIGANRDFGREEVTYRSNRLRFIKSQRINVKMGPRDDVETWASNDNFLDSVDFHGDLKNVETDTFEEREQFLGEINRSRRHRRSFHDREDAIYMHLKKDGERMNMDDDPNMVNYPFSQKGEGSFSSPSVSADIEFNKHLMEANALLKEAKEYLTVKSDEEQVETLLHKAAELFRKAIEMKPMSLLSVGQLGNTYLLHGELKLKRTRRLRALLAESDEIWMKKRGKALENDDQVDRRDRIASLLIRVCEECEEILVEAGKKYRLALSIDGNDMKALYNWGLALSFRAELIADIGPEAAFDADKVFMAAIDKFDAMLSKSNACAPDALFRWGVALQQRSRLRPRNKNEKVKLLQQAKRLYEDALNMDSNNLQVKEALYSCISELDFRSY